VPALRAIKLFEAVSTNAVMMDVRVRDDRGYPQALGSAEAAAALERARQKEELRVTAGLPSLRCRRRRLRQQRARLGQVARHSRPLHQLADRLATVALLAGTPSREPAAARVRPGRALRAPHRPRAAAFDPRHSGPAPPVVLTDDFNPIDAIVARQLRD
jgi:hypothetical protein